MSAALVAVAFTPWDFFTRIGFHPAPLVILAAMVVAYRLGVRRYEAPDGSGAPGGSTTAGASGGAGASGSAGGVGAAGRRWPVTRSASFALAVVILVVATLSGLASYTATSFTVTAVAQLGIFMLAPIFLCLSAPVTLAVETAGPRWRRRILAVVEGSVGKVLYLPVLTFALFCAAVSLLYFVGQYRVAAAHGWALQLTNLELLLAGCAFVWPVMGADPRPRRLGVGWRILYVLLATMFYSVLGLAMESQARRIAPAISISNLHTGAGVLWTAGEMLAIATTIGILIQWLFVDEGRAARADRTNAAEDAKQLAMWRAQRRAAALADVRASRSVIVRSRPAGTERSDRSAASARMAPARSELTAADLGTGGAGGAESAKDQPT